MWLRVTYGRVTDFIADYRDQISRGGLLVRVTPEPPPARGTAVDLEIVTPIGAARVTGSVIQVLAGAGIAVSVSGGDLSELERAAQNRAVEGDGAAPIHELVTAPFAPPAEPAVERASGAPRDPGLAAKIQLALHGDKNQRAAILRDTIRTLHVYVLRNPGIQLDEIVAIARMTTTSADVLAAIAGRREWGERSDVASALVRNPKTPVPLAIRMLDHVSPTELRQLAKQTGVRDAVQRAARKKVVG